MNILERLMQLANKLDKSGLHSEATLLDEIIKEAAGPIDSADNQAAKELAKRLEGDFSPYSATGQAFKKEVLDLYERGEGISGIMKQVGERYSNLMRMDNQLKEIMPQFSEKVQQIAQWRAQKEEGATPADEQTPSGEASTGKEKAEKPKNKKLERWQREYNKAYKELLGLQIMTRSSMRKMFQRPLNPDGQIGPKTRQAQQNLPKIQEMINREKAARQEESAGVASTGPEKMAPPAAPASQADPAVVQQQAIQKVFSDAVSQLQGMGYKMDNDVRTLIMQRVQSHAGQGAAIDITTAPGQIVPMVVKDIQSDLGAPQ